MFIHFLGLHSLQDITGHYKRGLLRSKGSDTCRNTYQRLNMTIMVSRFRLEIVIVGLFNRSYQSHTTQAFRGPCCGEDLCGGAKFSLISIWYWHNSNGRVRNARAADLPKRPREMYLATTFATTRKQTAAQSVPVHRSDGGGSETITRETIFERGA